MSYYKRVTHICRWMGIGFTTNDKDDDDGNNNNNDINDNVCTDES
jgi:hypothetical protein